MQLTFFRDGHWVIEPTGLWDRDNVTGRNCAEELLRAMNDQQVPAMLWFVVNAMPRNEDFNGISVGFFHEIASTALIGYDPYDDPYDPTGD